MSQRTLEELFASVPEHIKAKAIYEHILELCTAGEEVKASSLFESLCSVPGHDAIKAQSAWQLVRHFINHGCLKKAQSCYAVLEALEQSDIVQEIRAKAAHILGLQKNLCKPPITPCKREEVLCLSTVKKLPKKSRLVR